MVGLRRRTILLALMVLGVLVVGLAIFSVTGFAVAYVEELEESFPLQPGEFLRIRALNGSITYTRWAGEDVVIQATKEVRGMTRGLARRYADRVRIEMVREQDGVRAETLRASALAGVNVSVRFVVQVPDGWSGRVVLETSNGSVRAEHLYGDATVSSSNGSVVVHDHQGSLRARSTNGRIELARVETVLQAQTSNGPVRVDQAVLQGSGYLRTSNGSVDLQAFLIPGASYDVTSSNGSMTFTLVEPDVALDLRTTNSSIRLNTEVIASVADGRHLVGRIGGGAARLTATTTNGPITLNTSPGGTQAFR